MDKRVWLITGFFVLLFLIRLAPSIIDQNFSVPYRDNLFHTEIVRRIQMHEPLNEAVNKTDIDPNAYWTQDYVTNYPKLFHHITALLPFNAEPSVNIMASFLFMLLFLGMFELTYWLTGSIEKSFGSIALFIFLDLLFNAINFGLTGFTAGYMFWIYAQLMLNVGFIVGVIILVELSKRKMWIPMVVVFIIGIIYLTMTHGYSYHLHKWLEPFAIARIIVMLSTVVIPFFIKWKYHRWLIYLLPFEVCWIIFAVMNMWQMWVLSSQYVLTN